jgi:predicted DNA-binding protein with PD1-like motif
MKICEGRLGRVFVLRLEDGDVVPGCIERFAQEKRVAVGHVILVGGIGAGEVVVGPRRSNEMPPQPMILPVDGVHEVAGVGVIAPDERGKTVLHIHAALGRSGKTMTGCLRPGVTTWLVGEAIIYEILDAEVSRVSDARSGFALLQPRSEISKHS